MVLCEAGTTANSWPPMLTICGHTPDQHFVAPQHCSINSMARPCHRQNRKRRQAPHPTLYGLPCNELKHCRHHFRPLQSLSSSLPGRRVPKDGRECAGEAQGAKARRGSSRARHRRLHAASDARPLAAALLKQPVDETRAMHSR